MSTPQSTVGTEKPQCVLVYLPGSMQMIFDQSLGVIARQITSACNQIESTTAYISDSVEELNITPEANIQKCEIKCYTDPQHGNIVIVNANYMTILSKTLESSSYFCQFVRLCRLMITSGMLLCKIMRPRSGHPDLTRGNKAFLVLAYLLIGIALVAAGVAIFDLVKDLVKEDVVKDLVKEDLLKSPDWTFILTGLTVLTAVVLISKLFIVGIIAFAPPTLIGAALATGREYYGLVRYVLKSERRDEIQKYFHQILRYISSTYPSVPIHLLCFSFGCIVGFDYLFDRSENDTADPKPITNIYFIGFPYAIGAAGAPKFFSNRQWPRGGIIRWLNLYLADDVLGSRLTGHLHQIFRS